MQGPQVQRIIFFNNSMEEAPKVENVSSEKYEALKKLEELDR